MDFNEKMLKSLLRMVPQKYLNGIPELIIKAINDRVKSTKVDKEENTAVMIFPGIDDCQINIIAIDMDDNIRIMETYSGKEFINSLLKEAENG